MAHSRVDLQTLLKTLCDNVYFQPPPSVQMSFPAIVYRRSDIKTEFADNSPYKNKKRYQVTVIDKNPDSDVPDKVLALPSCSYNRFFTAEGLNHDVYDLFF